MNKQIKILLSGFVLALVCGAAFANGGGSSSGGGSSGTWPGDRDGGILDNGDGTFTYCYYRSGVWTCEVY